jgi:Transcription factor zinc-finger
MNPLLTSLNVLEFLFPVLLIGGSMYGIYRRRHRSVDTPGASVLLAFYSDGAKMHPLIEGTVDGMHYAAILATNHALPKGTALLYRVELPYSSRIHLIGVPKKSVATQLDPTGSGFMERVQLEGDFNNYFSLFCEKGMQTEARYVLDPKAMAFVVDFCQAHNWEIVRNELYFLQATGAENENDKTGMFADIEGFVREIRPALEKPLSDEELRAQTPYGKDRRRNLSCPICAAIMNNTGMYFECPNDDGILASGKTLPTLIKKLRIDDVSKDVPARAMPLTCPACQSSMKHVPYNFSAIVIDSCPNCPYRWLDAAEIKTSVS